MTIIDVTKNLLSGGANPTWRGVTPSDLSSQAVKDISFDRTSIAPPIGAYCLASDGTDSEFRYAADSFAIPVVWTPGSTFSGEYDILRSASIAGSVLAYSPGGTDVALVDSFTINPSDSSYQDGAYVTDASKFYKFVVTGDWYYSTPPNPTSYRLDAAEFNTTDSWATHAGGGSTSIQLSDGSFTPPSTDAYNALHKYNFFPVAGTGAVFSIRINDGGWSDNENKTIQVDVYEITPATVRYSDDNGATVGSAILVGGSPGSNGAFDLLPIGGASIASAAGKVVLATSLGGSYSDAPGGSLSAGNPVALCLPVRIFPHGAYQTNSTTPDFIMGADTDNSGASLWKVNGAGSVTDITPVSGCTIVPHCLTTWQTSAVCYILVAINNGGVYEVWRSLDGGSTWSLSRTCSTAPVYLRYKRFYNPVAYLIEGSELRTSSNNGASWALRGTPSSDAGVSMDIYG